MNSFSSFHLLAVQLWRHMHLRDLLGQLEPRISYSVVAVIAAYMPCCCLPATISNICAQAENRRFKVIILNFTHLLFFNLNTQYCLFLCQLSFQKCLTSV